MSEKPSFTQLIKMAKEMQKNMEKMQESLSSQTISATAGTTDTTVTAKVSGLQLVTGLEFSPAAYAAGPQILAELTISAVNKALEDARETTKTAMLDLYEQSSIEMSDESK
jgi:DNA-binding protein YbaB